MFKFPKMPKAVDEIEVGKIFDLDVDFYEFDEFESDSTDTVDFEYTNQMIIEDITDISISWANRQSSIYETLVKEEKIKKKKEKRIERLKRIKMKFVFLFKRFSF